MSEVVGIIVISDDVVKVKIGDSKPRKIGNPGLSDGYIPSHGDEVTCQSDNGQIRYVRPKNTEFVHPVIVPIVVSKSKDELKFGDRKAIQRDFRNPKNFVPTPRRPKVGPLTDSRPDWHDHAHDGCISGVLEVTATVETELLILDTARASVAANKHKTFDTRVDGDEVIIAGSALKGSIRSAFEMVSNSRMSIFTSKKALGSRVQADGVQLVPVRIETLDGKTVARLLPGTSKIGDTSGQPAQRVQHAAWISDNVAPVATNGKSCEVELHKFQHRGKYKDDFRIWKAMEVTVDGRTRQAEVGHNSLTRIGNEVKQVKGWISSSGRLIHNKRDERVFFTTQGDQFVDIDDSVKKHWKRLLTNYREVNERVLQANQEQRGSHVTDISLGELADGTLAYADIVTVNGEYSIRGLYPVQLSRRLDRLSPLDLLREELRPAQKIDELSPAERLFGWVGQTKAVPSAFRGRVAIDEARVPSSKLRKGQRTLEILASPKPSQARFYLGVERASDGSPIAFDDGEKSKDIRFDEQKVDGGGKKVLRGRAIFLRPKLSDIAPQRNSQDDQNRSITSVIPPGTEFTFQIHVSDARPVDLGALLWLLEGGNEDRAISIGFGKPLGYGSVKLRLSKSELLTTAQLKESWLNWDAPSIAGNLVTECIEAFKDATVVAYAVDAFESAAHISAYIAATEDPTGKLPIHYPREEHIQDPEGRNFKWFTSNEKIDRGEVKHGLALPDLGGPSDGFPYFR
jgi:CRISPR-associated protein (TIGR03986 family)